MGIFASRAARRAARSAPPGRGRRGAELVAGPPAGRPAPPPAVRPALVAHREIRRDERGGEMAGSGLLFVDDDGLAVLSVVQTNLLLAGLDAVVLTVTGTSLREGALQLPGFDPGRPLSLVPDLLRRYDQGALGVWDLHGRLQAGLVPREVAVPLTRALRSGRSLGAMSLWEWRRDGRRVGLRIVVGPGRLVEAWSVAGWTAGSSAEDARPAPGELVGA